MSGGVAPRKAAFAAPAFAGTQPTPSLHIGAGGWLRPPLMRVPATSRWLPGFDSRGGHDPAQGANSDVLFAPCAFQVSSRGTYCSAVLVLR